VNRAWTFGIILVILICTSVVGAAERRGRWQLLGEQEVEFKNDHDRIDVKRNAGPFRQLRIDVRDAPIEIREMVVTFADGKTFKPKIRAHFAEGRGSHVIDLPGNRRLIDAVDFVYRSINRREGKGKILLYAQ
jgi:hypothetical protein